MKPSGLLAAASGLLILLGVLGMKICYEERGGKYEGETVAYGVAGVALVALGVIGMCWASQFTPRKRRRN